MSTNSQRTIIGIAAMVVVLAFIAAGAMLGRHAPSSAHAQPDHSTALHVSARTTPQGYGVAVIHGCPAEDSCRADYHANGTWTIRPWVRDH